MQRLQHDHAEAPHVASEGVGASLQALGAHVRWRAQLRDGKRFRRLQLLVDAVVAQLDDALTREQHVCRAEVPVQLPQAAVEVLEPVQRLQHHHAHDLFGEAGAVRPAAPDELSERTRICKLRRNQELAAVVEGVDKREEVVMRDL